jgi:hypothetical protein
MSPTQEQLNAWFAVLRRLVALQDDPLKPAFAPEPLRQDIADCVDRGWVRVWKMDGQKPVDHARLVITPEGREMHDLMRQDLEAQGWKV